MEDIAEQVKPILLKYNVKKASLFGSYARGDFDVKSDVDILFQPPTDMGLEVVSLKRELEEKLNKKVDLISYNGISKYLKQYILSNQVQLL